MWALQKREKEPQQLQDMKLWNGWAWLDEPVLYVLNAYAAMWTPSPPPLYQLGESSELPPEASERESFPAGNIRAEALVLGRPLIFDPVCQALSTAVTHTANRSHQQWTPLATSPRPFLSLSLPPSLQELLSAQSFAWQPWGHHQLTFSGVLQHVPIYDKPENQHDSFSGRKAILHSSCCC